MALSDLIGVFKTVNPFANRRFANALYDVLDAVGAVTGVISEDNLIAPRIEADSLALIGDEEGGTYIGGGYVTGVTGLGGSGGDDAIGGTFENVVFNGAVNILDGDWTFINCTFRNGFYASGGDIILEGGFVLGSAIGNGVGSTAKLTLFENWPTDVTVTVPLFADPG